MGAGMSASQDAYPLLSVEEALARVLAAVHPLEAETVPILDALGRVLAEDVHADMDIPPLDNSAMDGYAVRAADLVAPQAGDGTRLRVIGDLAAGRVGDKPVGPGQAMRIMTGAPVPVGADTVVRFEDARQRGNWVEIVQAPERGRNVRRAGEDVRAGDAVLRAGMVVRPDVVGMLASVGRAQVRVVRRPRVAILATGDEIVEIDARPGPGKIRNINSYSNAAQVAAYGGIPIMLGIAPDTVDGLVHRLRQGLEAGADLFLTSGGVSVGDFDFVKQVLVSEGEIDFWWINMKPGKPMAFGNLSGVPMLGLPGNPVAAMISFALFGRPAIARMLGKADWSWPSTTARLQKAIAPKDGRRHYLRVRLVGADGDLEAVLTGDQGSGILTSMVQADGLAVIPEDCEELAAGSLVQVLLLESDP